MGAALARHRPPPAQIYCLTNAPLYARVVAYFSEKERRQGKGIALVQRFSRRGLHFAGDGTIPQVSSHDFRFARVVAHGAGRTNCALPNSGCRGRSPYVTEDSLGMTLGATGFALKTQNRGNEAKKSLKTKEVSRKTNLKRSQIEAQCAHKTGVLSPKSGFSGRVHCRSWNDWKKCRWSPRSVTLDRTLRQTARFPVSF